MQAANAVALPSLLWGLEAFPVNTNTLLKLQTLYLPVLRSIFGKKSQGLVDEWIQLRSTIRQYFRMGSLVAPAIFLYKRQEGVYRFLRSRPAFDLWQMMQWRGSTWLQQQSRRTRPARASSGTPPRQYESEFTMREGYSLDFRALQYAQRHSALPFLES